ncbi:MAG: hypothetical protein ACJ74O_20660 [Frankiaceae bacterium]
MLVPADLRRIPSPMLRARLAAFVLDQPRPDTEECTAVMAAAVAELLAGGASVADISAGTGVAERRLRRLVTRPIAA